MTIKYICYLEEESGALVKIIDVPGVTIPEGAKRLTEEQHADIASKPPYDKTIWTGVNDPKNDPNTVAL